MVIAIEFSLISPGQNGLRLADVIFKYIFMNEKFGILMKIH